MKHIQLLNVYLNNTKVGQLEIDYKNIIYFSYDYQWLQTGFNISPFDLEMVDYPQKSKDDLFQGLHGIFADSISDGWGLLLVDRALQEKYQWKKHEINQLDRLFFMGNRTMGALEYKPSQKHIDDNQFNLVDIFEKYSNILSGNKDQLIENLYIVGGSPGGARPKALYAKKDNHYILNSDHLPLNYESWILKFFSKNDSLSLGKIEMAYADMARKCGIEFPDTELVEVNIHNKPYSFFSVKRFDRSFNTKYHVASLSGLLYASHRMPSISYKDILLLTKELCSQHDVENVMKVLLFNILMHNKDDHSKNFSYIYKNNQWHFSPAYDLTFNFGLNNHHMTDIYGNSNPTILDIKKLANEFSIKNIDSLINTTIGVANQWKEIAISYQINADEVDEINKEIQQTIVNFNIINNKKSIK